MDKDWMSNSRLSKEYEDGVESFLNFAVANGKDPHQMSCPCAKCGNLRIKDVKTIRAHLIYNGMDLTYHSWIFHGEKYQSHASEKDESKIEDCDFYSKDPIDMVHEAFVDNPTHFSKLLEEAEMPLYPGCVQFTKLSTIVKLYNLKAKHGWSDTGFTGEEISLFIFFEDIHNIAELEAISGSCICIYMCHLYKECENENLLGRFRFANPYVVSHNPKTDSSKKADALAKRLIGTSKNQFVLVPCNVGWHWILTVIDPHSETVHVLDSLNNKSHVEEWKSVVEMAMKVFNMSTHGKRTRKNMIWNVIKCPQQPDGKQCRFYVMRFMKDIIENCGSPASMSITLSFDEGYYSKKEIDEVRTEWAEFVHDFID